MESSVAAYAALQKELLELEREEEKAETVASADGERLSVLEASGLAISRLSLHARSSDAGGRQILQLVPRGGRTLSAARISTGDIVGLRQLNSSSASAHVPATSPTSLLAEGIVTSFDERSLHITIDRPLPDDIDPSAIFVALKLASDVTHTRYTRALSDLPRAADDTSHPSYKLVRVLFGDATPRFAPRDSDLPTKVAAPLQGLNVEQEAAVRNALAATDLAVIHGPPGTGKTQALTAYVCAEAARGSRLLLVAPSNVAIDTLAERLATTQTGPPPFVRSGHPARVLPAVQPYTLDAQLSATDEMQLARDIRSELDELEAKACSCNDRAVRKGLRIQQRELRRELRERERAALQRLLARTPVVLATVGGAGARVLDIVAEFDVVVVDEAAQALEAACWAPLLRGHKAVFAGDPYQLGGMVRSAEAVKRGLQSSILDRVFGMAVLKEAIVMLTTQYRMHATISDWSSNEFYSGELQAHDSVASRRVADLEGCHDEANTDEQMITPFILIDTAGGDCEEDTAEEESVQVSEGARAMVPAAASRSNEGEAEITAAIVMHFFELGLRSKDIGVISPYAGQVELLRGKLWGQHGRSLEVATVDSFQGREKEVIVLSLVRSNEAGNVGFLADDRRLNVAITRAKRCVVVVADSETVASHPLLDRLVRYVEDYGVVRSAVVDFPEIVGTDSALRRPREAIEAEERATEARKTEGRATRKGRTTAGRERKGRGTTKSRVEKASLADTLKRAVTIGDAESKSTAQKRGAGGHDLDGEDELVKEARERLGGEIETFMKNAFVVEKVFSNELSSLDRRIVHELAEEMGLHHASSGMGADRQIRVWKKDDGLAALAAQLEKEMESEAMDDLLAKELAEELGGSGGEGSGGGGVDWFQVMASTRFDGLQDDNEDHGEVEEDKGIGAGSSAKSSTANQQMDEEEKKEDDGEYAQSNSLLAELRKQREQRSGDGAGSSSASQASNVTGGRNGQNAGGGGKKKKRGKKGRKGAKKQESDDDFDAVLAKYGAPPPEKHPVFSPLVAQIVNGTLQQGVESERELTREQKAARERLNAKLARESEQRKRKAKKKGKS